jgi:GNAT superfamily N-acetyltransferase
MVGNLLKPLFSLAMDIHARIWPNRAADPKNEDIIERSYPYFEHIWSGKRAESWYLAALAVHPNFHGTGVGKKLAQWGIEQAQAEGVCASLVAAYGTDEFYKKCGFDEQYGRAGEAEGNPLADVAGSNMYWYWPRT